MEQSDESLTAGVDGSEGTAEPATASGGDKDYDDILELNQFDGLPYSSRFYTLLRERKELPVWKAKCEFMDILTKEQFVNVSGSARTGRSSQVVQRSVTSDDSLPWPHRRQNLLNLLVLFLQIPQWCAEHCLSVNFQHGMVVCSQTLAQRAVDLALRVADEMDVNIGHEVGYSIPMETCCTCETILRYVSTFSPDAHGRYLLFFCSTTPRTTKGFRGALFRGELLHSCRLLCPPICHNAACGSLVSQPGNNGK